jgi:hypothetical protein
MWKSCTVQFEDGSQVWLAAEKFTSAFSDVNWEETGIIPDVQAFSEWDTFYFETDPSILAPSRFLDISKHVNLSFEYRKLGDFTYHLLTDPNEIKSYLMKWIMRNGSSIIMKRLTNIDSFLDGVGFPK